MFGFDDSSTKAMMHDGKCICGWCGSKEHITGDLSCAAMIASKKKQADKQRNGKSKARKALEMGIKAQAVKNTLTFVHTVVEAAQSSHLEPSSSGDSVTAHSASATTTVATRPPSRGPPSKHARRVSLQIAAKRIISDQAMKKQTSNQDEALSSLLGQASSQDTANTVVGGALLGSSKAAAMTSPPAVSHTQTPNSLVDSNRSLQATAPVPRKVAISDFKGLSSASNKLYAYEQQHLQDGANGALPALKVEEVRKSVFPEQVESQYRQTLVAKVKKLATAKDYFDTRTQVLETMKEIDAKESEERYKAYEQVQPRKPKIPKPIRSLCTKNRQQKGPRPDRFNRKINRMLKRLRLKEHPLPVMEESLKDF